MGVDVTLSLPPAVCVEHVASVLARLHGHTCVRDLIAPHARPGDSHYGARVANVLGIRIETDRISPQMVHIHLEQRTKLGTYTRRYSYHFESPVPYRTPACTVHTECAENREMGEACWASTSSRGGRRFMQARSTPTHVAAFRALASFFGGVVDHQDCDDSYGDHVVPDLALDLLDAEDGEPWERKQDRIETLKPLKRKDVAACERFAAYDYTPGETNRGYSVNGHHRVAAAQAVSIDRFLHAPGDVSAIVPQRSPGRTR